MSARELFDQARYEIRRHRAGRPTDDVSWRVQLRRWWWRFARRHDGEMCSACGRPVALACPSYWLTDDELWESVVDPTGGSTRCIPCFTRAADEAGVHVWWRAIVGHAPAHGPLPPVPAPSVTQEGGER